MAANTVGKRAVVVGAGIGGLAAAAALADYFDQVVVFERDGLSSEPTHRTGTPQSKHLYALLAGGLRAFGELFAGFQQRLARAGAVPLRAEIDIRIEAPGFHPFPSRDLGWTIYSMSRPLLESVVRQCATSFSQVVLRTGCRVREFLVSADRTVVTGVVYENADGRSDTLPADLVIDASGRGILTLDVLKAIGQPPPEESAIGIDLGYATAIFAIPDNAPPDWKGVLTLAEPPDNIRGGVMLPLEGGDRWMATLAGRHDAKPPGDGEGFLSFARQLVTPTIYNAIRHARRLSDVARFGFPASVWRHFERLEQFPRGLLPFGDAICRFNPVWGQGMSVAAQEAVLLRRLLGSKGEPLPDLARSFFARAAELIETPWASAAVPDFAFPQTEGRRPDDLDRILAFNNGLLRLAAEDPAVHKLVMEVQHLLRPRSVLQDPELVERVGALMTAGSTNSRTEEQ